MVPLLDLSCCAGCYQLVSEGAFMNHACRLQMWCAGTTAAPRVPSATTTTTSLVPPPSAAPAGVSGPCALAPGFCWTTTPVCLTPLLSQCWMVPGSCLYQCRALLTSMQARSSRPIRCQTLPSRSAAQPALMGTLMAQILPAARQVRGRA